ncbi:hypothetical protein SRHO_G00154840 [Serrasalmus rhombeus]
MRFMNMHTRGAPLSPSPPLSHTRLGEKSVSPARAFVFTLGPLLLDSGRFYLTSGHQGDTIDMRETPATSGRLGDSGYPLKRWLLTPFPNPQSTEERRYNDVRTLTRSERTIGLLKGRWRCLDASGGRPALQPGKSLPDSESMCRATQHGTAEWSPPDNDRPTSK